MYKSDNSCHMKHDKDDWKWWSKVNCWGIKSSQADSGCQRVNTFLLAVVPAACSRSLDTDNTYIIVIFM